jgi:hypothetical protein
VIPDDSRDFRLERIERALALGGLALIGGTWRLWTPQNLFPRIPLFESVAALPASLDAILTWLALGLCCAALLSIVLFAARARLVRAHALIVAITMCLLVVLDQHRLQPWCVHIAVCLLVAAFANSERRLPYLTWFTASIYVYSALGKFDAQFLHTVGQDFVRVILEGFGWNAQLVAYRLRLAMALGFPIGELCIGVGLLFRPTRAIAAMAAIGMHAVLLWVLGPWGLRHAWGVLLWNLLFIALNILMFLWPARRSPVLFLSQSGSTQEPTLDANSDASSNVSSNTTSDIVQQSGRYRFGIIDAFLICCLILPVGERLGLVDHWLGWALYAPHSSRVHVAVSATAVAHLPSVVKPFVHCDSEETALWCDVRFDRWSLATLGAPVTPQQRFQIGAARALTHFVADHEIRVDVLSTADRWSGRRKDHQLRDASELNAAGDDYWFNTTPCFNPPAE